MTDLHKSAKEAASLPQDQGLLGALDEGLDGPAEVPARSETSRDWQARTRRLWDRSFVRQSFWVLAAQFGTQALRFMTNLILARLVAPDLFGVMLIVNSVRTGIELLSDVGIGQNIVRHQKSRTVEFLSTAFVVQAIRGVLLTIIGIGASYPLGRIYHEETVAPVFLACSAIFLLDGFISPLRFAYQRDQRVREIATFQLIMAVVNAVVHVLVLIAMPTIWGLTSALLISVLTGTVISWPYFGGRGGIKFRFQRRYARDIMSFGKWIFLSTAMLFAASNFDRLYLGALVPLAALGLYGLAKSLAEVFLVTVQRACDAMLLPRVAAAHNSGSLDRKVINRPRVAALLIIGVALGGATAGSDVFVRVVYDARYISAGAILPILLIGSWFAMLSAMADGLSIGAGKPQNAAIANVIKLLWLCVAVPLALKSYSLVVAVACVSFAEVVRYIVSGISAKRWQMSFFRVDIIITSAMLVWSMVVRSLLLVSGLVHSWAPVLPAASPFHL